MSAFQVLALLMSAFQILVRKNKTFRKESLGSQTLSLSMVCKSKPGECYNRFYTTDELKTLRSGPKASLQKQQ